MSNGLLSSVAVRLAIALTRQATSARYNSFSTSGHSLNVAENEESCVMQSFIPISIQETLLSAVYRISKVVERFGTETERR